MRSNCNRHVGVKVRCAALATITILAASSCTTLRASKGAETVLDPQTIELMTALARVAHPDQRSREMLLGKVVEQRNDVLGTLLMNLDSEKSPDVKAAVLYLIGCYRLDQGVRELVEYIDFEVVAPADPLTESLWGPYPAQEALIAIGRPSITPMLELLATDPKPLRRDLAVEVIRDVEDPDIARFILQRAHAAATDPKRRANLADALLRLDKLPK